MAPRSFQPHLTVAAIAERDNRFLVVRELIDGREVLNNPAGHIEDGESPEQSVVREVMEETGYTFVPKELGGVYLWRHPDSGETFVRFNYVGQCSKYHPEAKLDTGIIQAEWLSLNELKQRPKLLRSPLVVQSFSDYLEGVRYPLDIVKSYLSPREYG